MTKGEQRKNLEAQLSKRLGIAASYADIIKIRLLAARLAS